MAISVFLDPAQMPARTQEQTAFDNAVAYVMANLPTLVQQMNATEAGMNTTAAGGMYTLAYKWGISLNASVGFSAGGYMAFTSGGNGTVMAPATSADALYLDTKDSSGTSTAALLNSTVSGNTSTIKGHIRLVKLGDATKWARFSVTGFANNGLYGNFNITPIDSSSSSPFATNDIVLLFFQRTGDKGDTGPTGTYPMLHVRDEKASGTSPGSTGTAGATVTRTLNTVKKNSITGASLASNQITLPAGTYRFRGYAPSMNDRNQAQLYSVTGAAVLHVGTSEFSSQSGGYASTKSFLGGEIVLAGTTVIELRHYAQTIGGLGLAASSGQVEVYSEIIFEKVT
jgi:hypothetical protein